MYNLNVNQECIYALEVNGHIVHYFVCTNDNLTDLAIGHLVAHGCLQKADIVNIAIDQEAMIIKVEAKTYADAWNMHTEVKQIKQLPYQAASTLPALDRTAIKERMFAYHVKGQHTAMLITPHACYLDKDVSRHCALDKVIAKADDYQDCTLVTSGRISIEMLLRARTLGIKNIATLKYPTDSALDIAMRLGINCIEIK
ncbi:MAG: formate dehydrogenase accessory sulfurtransferase FdhD [Erysipelotrichaceae bacterium]|nr:formate dehydrogenase accessory sulfurtransferase FdhD [Erysipelotrichaceae bacterium]MDY5251152.1 formate dehydrogenase accessory sulfurtransferase FdhD [Erysipelotrichaceae bacterium]